MLRRSANSLCVSPLASYSSATRTHSGFSLCFDMPGRVRRLPHLGQAPQHVIGRTGTLEQRRSCPTDDLVSSLLEAMNTERLTPLEAARTGIGILMAGHETSLSMISNSCFLLLSH